MWDMPHVNSTLEELVEQGYWLRPFYRNSISVEEVQIRGLSEQHIKAARSDSLKAAIL
jgi:hypothetical protein